MNLAQEWSIRLAEQVAPDEVPLARTMVDAYLKGGEDREELRASAGTTPGAFIPGEMIVILPKVLFAVAGVGAPLLALLAKAGTVGPFLEMVKNALVVLELKLKKDSLSQPAPVAAPIATGPDYLVLRKTVQSLTVELRSAGLPEERCDLICYRVLRSMLENPESGAQFVQELVEASTK